MDKGSLWTDTFKGKYFGENKYLDALVSRTGASHAWKGIIHGVDLLRQECK